MKSFLAIAVAVFVVGGAFADTVVPTRTIRANAIIADVDVGLAKGKIDNGFARLEDVIGQEAKVTLYAGRAIRLDDIGPPALVARNEIVQLRFETGGLTIVTEGRALQRGGIGDQVRIMNLSSRNTLFGQVQADGSVKVVK